MLINRKNKIFLVLKMLLVTVAFFNITASAQIDTSKKVLTVTPPDSVNPNQTKIQIEKADALIGIKIGKDGYSNKFIGNVQVRSGDVVMTCDSAYLNERDNKLKAFGNVDILKGGATSAKANYVEYTGNTSQAIMKENVQIYDNGDQLITDDLVYNLKTKVGIYRKGGQLISDGTTVSSDYGKYNGRSKQSHFKGNVFITSPDSDIESKELTYNTQSKNIVFLDKSTIYGKDAVIETKKGSYNQKNGSASFSRRTTVENNEQIITANKIKYNEKTGAGSARGKVVIVNKEENTVLYADATNYNKETGYGIALGHIRYLDTIENIQLIAGKVEYNEFNDFLLATKNPLLITVTDNDSILIASDTMIALRNSDLGLLKNRIKKNDKMTFELLHKKHPDMLDDKKVIVCDKKVQIYGDSMQAVCDSMIYRQTDSIFNLYKKPVVWSSNQQAEGDTIYIYMANDKIRKTELRNNSFILNDTEYPKMYNQIKGKNIDAYFEDNEIKDALVMGNAESVYYATDDEDKFVGMNKAEGAKIKMLFKEKQVDRIVFYNKPKGAFYPMEKINPSDRFLDGFKWKKDLRPKSRNQLRYRVKGNE